MTEMIGSRFEAEYWAPQIERAWRRGIAAVIDAGQLLLKAQAALPHGEWCRLVERRLPFGPRHAARLMRIGSDSRLTAHMERLPNSILALYALTGLDDAEFDKWLKTNRRSPRLGQTEVIQQVRQIRGSEQAIVPDPCALLIARIDAALQSSSGDPPAARGALWDSLCSDAALLRALIGNRRDDLLDAALASRSTSMRAHPCSSVSPTERSRHG